MKYAIIADIHANVPALQAVMKDIARFKGINEIWCLGDIVGYGPAPHECINILRHYDAFCVSGNHDLAAVGKISTSDYDQADAVAYQYTDRQLTSDDKIYLRSLPQIIERDNFTLVHSSPKEPSGESIKSVSQAEDNLAYFKSRYCMVGHYHQSMIFLFDENGRCSSKGVTRDLNVNLGENRAIINPGGVGYTRDNDLCANYAMYDSSNNSIQFHRKGYNVGATQEWMRAAGLPIELVKRLGHGKIYKS